MAWSWYWHCKECFPIQKLLNVRNNYDDLRKIGYQSFKNELQEASPYHHLELMSNRPKENRRCENCGLWHIENKGSEKRYCNNYNTLSIPKCNKNHDKSLFFIEKDAILLINSTYCQETPEYIGDNGIYHLYFYHAYRYERYDETPQIVISTIYFTGKNGNNYGKYSPYLFLDKEMNYPFDKIYKWMKETNKTLK